MTHEAGSYERLTPPGVGGLHVFEVRGPAVEALLRNHFQPRGNRRRELSFGLLADGDDVIDEVIVRRLPAGIELSVHGGPAIEARVSALLEGSGLRRQSLPAPERDRQAGHALRQEALDCLTRSIAPHAVLFFLSVLEGGLTRDIAGWIATLTPGGVAQEARGVAVEAAIDSTLQRAPFGLAMNSPPSVVLSGPVNAGKSTLFNALLERERAIVTEVAGTTRDVIEAPLELEGYPFLLHDTAGIRATSDQIESQGIARARAAREKAGMVVAVHPGKALLKMSEEELAGAHAGADVLVASQSDLLDADALRQLSVRAPDSVPVAATRGTGLEALRSRIVFRSPFAGPAVREFPCPFTVRQVDLMKQAAAALPHDPSEAALLLRRLLDGED